MWEKHLCRHQGLWKKKGSRCYRCQSRDFPAAHGKDHAGAGGCPKKFLTSQALDRTCDPVEDPLLSILLPKGLHAMEGIHTEAVMDELHPVGRTCSRNSWRTFSCGRDSALEQGKSAGSSQEGTSSRDNVWWTDHGPYSPTPCNGMGEAEEKIRIETEPKMEGGVKNKRLRLGFFCHCPTLIWV